MNELENLKPDKFRGKGYPLTADAIEFMMKVAKSEDVPKSFPDDELSKLTESTEFSYADYFSALDYTPGEDEMLFSPQYARYFNEKFGSKLGDKVRLKELRIHTSELENLKSILSEDKRNLTDSINRNILMSINKMMRTLNRQGFVDIADLRNMTQQQKSRLRSSSPKSFNFGTIGIAKNLS